MAFPLEIRLSLALLSPASWFALVRGDRELYLFLSSRPELVAEAKRFFSRRILAPWFSCSVLPDGRKHGRQELFDMLGRRVEESFYEDGLRSGPYHTWYPNGRLQEESTYRSGSLSGPYFVYDESGRFLVEGRFEEGKKEGLFSWYSEGRLTNRCKFVDGLRWGLEERFEEDGLSRRSFYREGRELCREEISRSREAVTSVLSWPGGKDWRKIVVTAPLPGNSSRPSVEFAEGILLFPTGPVEIKMEEEPWVQFEMGKETVTLILGEREVLLNCRLLGEEPFLSL